MPESVIGSLVAESGSLETSVNRFQIKIETNAAANGRQIFSDKRRLADSQLLLAVGI